MRVNVERKKLSPCDTSTPLAWIVFNINIYINFMCKVIVFDEKIFDNFYDIYLKLVVVVLPEWRLRIWMCLYTVFGLLSRMRVDSC